MSNVNNIGECALCRKKNVELKLSHIIPKAIYKRTRTLKNSRFRQLYEPQIIHQDGEKKHMLCHECEEFFSGYETKFCNQFLDKYLSKPKSKLPKVTNKIDFYILTVAWRILYDDLYVYNSFENDHERKFLEEYENKLGKYIFEKYIEKNPEETSTRTAIYQPDLVDKTFGESVAEIEKAIRSSSSEDISEIKNYIYKLSDLGFDKSITAVFESMILGYSFYNTTRTKFYIISMYNGLVITTVYSRSRNVILTDDIKLLKESCTSKNAIKKDIKNEVAFQFTEMQRMVTEIEEKWTKDGLWDKIKKRYSKKQ